MAFPMIACLLLMTTGIVSLFFRQEVKGRVVLAGAFISMLLTLPSVFSVLLSGYARSAVFVLAQPAGIVRFTLDPLSAFFLIPISIGGFLAAWYSIGYMSHYTENKKSLSVYYFFLPMLTACMFAVVLAGNSLVFLLVWEMMSIASFFLVIFEHEKEEVRKAGMVYLVAMQFGALLLLAAFAWTALQSGTLDMDGLFSVFQTRGPFRIILFLLFFAGFGIKAGFIPLHTWLPKAHPAAPSPVSALMSGVMIKTGIYGIFRLIAGYGSPEMGLALTIFFIAAGSALFGVVNAAAQQDIKKLLAYSSIENIGVIGMGLGLGMIGQAAHNHTVVFLGYSGALLHVLNHFIFKSALFYSAGAVYLRTQSRNMEKLGGLVHTMPVTAAIFLTAGMAITGLPMLNGFISELMIYLGFLTQLHSEGTWAVVSAGLGLGGLALTGILVALCFLKVFSVVFLGSPRSALPRVIKDPPWSMLLPMGVLLLLMPVIGLFPRLILTLPVHVISDLTNQSGDLLPGWILRLSGSLTRVFLLFAGLIAGFMLLRQRLLKRHGIQLFRTWDCGSRLSDSRLQYTGGSFVSPLMDLIGWAVQGKKQQQKPEGYFPKQAAYHWQPLDRIETLLIEPVLRSILWLMKPFEKIQSGKTRQYLLYGLVFLVLILISIIGTGP